MSTNALFLKDQWNRVALRALLPKLGQIFTVLVFLVSLLGGNTINAKADSPASVLAAPAKVVLIEPEGNIGNETDPTYKWYPVADAAYYRIGITDPTTTDTLSTWLAAADVCDATVCSALHSDVLPSVTIVDGDYTWYVRGRDALSVLGPWSDEMVFTIESVASGLNTTITNKPLNPSTSSDARFEFTSNEALATFECKLGSDAFAACTSPTDYTGLSDGSYTFEVRAVNGAETDPTPATYTWVISTAAVPAQVVLIGPEGNIGNVSNPTYRWNPVAGAESYKLGLVDPTSTGYYSAWLAAADVCDATVCSASHSAILAAVAVVDGDYTWYVQGRNAAGLGPWSSSMGFTIELAKAPDTMITVHPANPTSIADARFEFASTQAGSTFECKLDSGAFAACTSPKDYSLGEGSHTFQVRAAKNGLTDQSPASYTWMIDTTAPETTITSQPDDPSRSADATFEFSSETGSTFECKLDSGAFAACTSPKAYTGLSNGSYTFEVRAKDAAGNVDATPASYTWTINALPASGKYDDTHAGWVYSAGYPTYTDSNLYGGSAHYSGGIGKSAEFAFNGSQFVLSYTGFSNRGTMDVLVDGTKVGTINQYSPTRAWQATWTSGNLGAGEHTVKFVHASGLFVDIDAIEVKTYTAPVVPGIGKYDDTHASWTYSAGYPTFADSNLYGGSAHYSDGIGKSAEFTFTGSQFVLSYTGFSNRGTMDVLVDGTKVATINQYSPTRAWQATWTSGDLGAGQHTVKLVHASGLFVDIDAIEIKTYTAPQIPGIGKYDDTHAGWVYSAGYPTFADSNLYGGSAHYSNGIGKSAEFTFNGSQLTLSYTGFSNRGTMDVLVDGTKVGTINQYSPTRAWQATWTSGDLGAGQHTVKLVHASGLFVDIDAIEIKTFQLPGVGKYDDTHAGWTYTAGYPTFADSNLYGGSAHYSDGIGKSAEFTFSGSQFILTYTGFSNRGTMDVLVDGVKVDTIDQYSATRAWQATWTSDDLGAGEHTLKLVHASGLFVDIDAIEILP